MGTLYEDNYLHKHKSQTTWGYFHNFFVFPAESEAMGSAEVEPPRVKGRRWRKRELMRQSCDRLPFFFVFSNRWKMKALFFLISLMDKMYPRKSIQHCAKCVWNIKNYRNEKTHSKMTKNRGVFCTLGNLNSFHQHFGTFIKTLPTLKKISLNNTPLKPSWIAVFIQKTN